MSIKSVLIASLLLLLIFSVGVFIYQQYGPQSNSSINTPSQKTLVKNQVDKSKPEKNEHIDSKIPDEFYQQIIDNNIFRPLGWKPPKKPEQYILIGVASADNKNYSQAIILETKSNELHTAKVGDSFGNVVIKDIQQKQVILEKDGKEIKLQGGKPQFLR